MESLWKEIDEYVAKNKMLTKGDAVLAAVSGGVDSMCMLNYLLDRKDRMGVELAVFHFNHHLREEAGDDAAFVSAFCEKHDIPVFVREGDVEKEALDKGLTIEEAARQMRYSAMFDSARMFENNLAKEKEGHCKVVLAFAHNAGDQAETVLFRLFRGTGIKGIRGIEPVSSRNNFFIIRPFLGCSRNKIEACMKMNQREWVEDKTNEADDYTRNKIRHHIVDYAVKNINQKSIENICRASEDAFQGYEYIQRQTRRAFDECLYSCEGKELLNIKQLQTYDIYIQKQIILLYLEEKTVARKDLTADHIDAMLGLIHSRKNGRLDLPYGLKAIKEYNNFYLDNGLEMANGQCVCQPLDSENHEKLFDRDMIEQSIIQYSKEMDIPGSTYTKWLDYDKIKNRVEIRTRKTGDYIYINDSGNKISLKKYFINEKIPQQLRDKILLVVDESHVLWVVGYRISASAKVTGETKRVLELKYRKKND